MKKKRRRLLVDSKLQGALLTRVGAYWLLCVFALIALAAAPTIVFSGGADSSVVINRAIQAFGPSLVAALLVLPVLLFDALRFSHRFAGPMVRLRNELDRLAEGKWNGPIKFRDDDFWHDLSTRINHLAEELERHRSEGDQPAEAVSQEAGA